MPVVTPDGIVGRVVGVGPVTAQVMLITDERAAAGAVVGQLGQSNALGSVRGYGKNGLLEMRYVSGLETVNVGDYVVTTGQDGIYPPGLNVGAVVEVDAGLGHHAAHDPGQAGRAARLARRRSRSCSTARRRAPRPSGRCRTWTRGRSK